MIFDSGSHVESGMKEQTFGSEAMRISFLLPTVVEVSEWCEQC